MIVVSDSTPLITLMKAEQLEILRGLFGDVLIPDAVFREVTTNEKFKDEADLIRNCAFIKVVSVGDVERVNMLQRATGLDRGESEAIVYADENNADILLIDEEAGRKVAQNMNLPISGSIGVLVKAVQIGLISVDEGLQAIVKIRKANRHVSDRLLHFAENAMQATRK